MKTNFLLGGGVVGFILLISGGLHLIAGQTETEFSKQVAALGNTVQASDYQRGLLTSQAWQEIQLQFPYGLSSALRIEHQIQHTWLMTPTQVHTRILSAQPGRTWLELDSRLALDGSGISTLRIPAQQVAPLWQWQAGQGEFHFDAKQITGGLTIPEVRFNTLRLQNVTTDVQLHLQTAHEIAGTFQLHAATLSSTAGNFPALIGKQVHWQGNFRFRGGLLDLDFEISTAHLRIAEQAYHDGQLSFSLQNLASEMLSSLTAQAISIQQQPQFMRLMGVWALLEQSTRLLHFNPSAKIEKLVLYDTQGTALDISADFTGNTQSPVSPLQALQQLHATGAVKLSDRLLRIIVPTHTSPSEPHPLMQPWLQQGYIKYDKGFYQIHVELSDGHINIHDMIAVESKQGRN